MTTIEKLKNTIAAMQSDHVQSVAASFEYEAENIRYYSAITTKNNIQHKYTVRVQDWFENGEKQRFTACNCAAGAKGSMCRHIVRVAELDTERTGATLFLDNLANYKAHKAVAKTTSVSCGCVFNWDDKFTEKYCDAHFAEMQEITADREEYRFAA